MGHYETSTICTNGHFISSGSPNTSIKFCRDCGAGTIFKCNNCNTSIRGKYIVNGILDLTSYSYVPAYCHNCGFPYPWTEQLLIKTKKLIDLDEQLTDQEKADLFDSAKNIMTESESSTVEASLFKGLLNKAGNFLKEAMYKFAVDVASETAKKTLFP